MTKEQLAPTENFFRKLSPARRFQKYTRLFQTEGVNEGVSQCEENKRAFP